jgi:hypothetical protein
MALDDYVICNFMIQGEKPLSLWLCKQTSRRANQGLFQENFNTAHLRAGVINYVTLWRHFWMLCFYIEHNDNIQGRAGPIMQRNLGVRCNFCFGGSIFPENIGERGRAVLASYVIIIQLWFISYIIWFDFGLVSGQGGGGVKMKTEMFKWILCDPLPPPKFTYNIC